MGYSCTARASFTERGVDKFAGDGKTSNGLASGGFYERGREQADGAITGTVWRPLNAAEKVKYAHLSDVENRVAKAGSFKIGGDGKIVRFPGLSKEQKKQAEEYGAKLYDETFVKRANTIDELLPERKEF